jgi:uncharacterized protein YneF (UPF0154 family)
MSRYIVSVVTLALGFILGMFIYDRKLKQS